MAKTDKLQVRASDRLFPSINNLLIIICAVAHASSLIVDGQTHKHPRPKMRLNTQLMGY